MLAEEAAGAGIVFPVGVEGNGEAGGSIVSRRELAALRIITVTPALVGAPRVRGRTDRRRHHHRHRSSRLRQSQELGAAITVVQEGSTTSSIRLRCRGRVHQEVAKAVGGSELS